MKIGEQEIMFVLRINGENKGAYPTMAELMRNLNDIIKGCINGKTVMPHPFNIEITKSEEPRP